MGQAYTPGLLVTAETTFQTRRILPLAGNVKVSLNQQVSAIDVVAETFMPGNVTPLNMANALSVPPVEVPGIMLKKVGDTIAPGDILARTKGIFGYFKNEYISKIHGTLESISKITGQLIIRHEPIPIQVKAYVHGKVVQVIASEGVVVETKASLIQGIFGVGGETLGKLHLCTNDPQAPVTADQIRPEMQGKVVIGGARMTREAVDKARQLGVAALVSGGIDDQDLKEILGYDLGVAITGTEQLGITLIITEGFGDIGMAKKTFELLQTHAGKEASVNGATQIRAGVLRPEIVIPLTNTTSQFTEVAPTVGGGVLELGAMVRIIRDPYFGVLGNVTGLPAEPKVLGSGSKARVLEVTTEQGEFLIVPRANVELVGKG
jgi:hypothetical protein